MSTPFFIIAGVVVIATVALFLDHRLAMATMRRAQPPTTPERDAGFNDGLERAREIVDGISLSHLSEKRTLLAALSGARR